MPARPPARPATRRTEQGLLHTGTLIRFSTPWPTSARARIHEDAYSWSEARGFASSRTYIHGRAQSLAPGAQAAMPLLDALSSLDKYLTARVAELELPLALETLLMPFGCIHGYAGGIVGMPLLWYIITNGLGCWDETETGLPSGRAGFFLYMYTSAVGQTVSGALKITLNRTRPGMDLDAKQVLPRRHWLPGSPAFIARFSEERLRGSPLVLLGGMQHGVTKGLNGSEAGSFPSGDSMAGCCFAAMLCWCVFVPPRLSLSARSSSATAGAEREPNPLLSFHPLVLSRCTPLGMWGGLAYGSLPCLARVFYWYHWLGDVLAGAAVSFLASQIVLWFNGGAEAMHNCTWAAFTQQALPFFVTYMAFLKVLANAMRPPPDESAAHED